MARTVRDAALLLQVMAGPDQRDPFTIDAPPEDYLAACEGDLVGKDNRAVGGAVVQGRGHVGLDGRGHAA